MLCRSCGKRFVLEPRRARYDDVFKHHVLAALGDGLNASTAQRVFKVRRQTITAWQQKAASDDPSPQSNTKR